MTIREGQFTRTVYQHIKEKNFNKAIEILEPIIQVFFVQDQRRCTGREPARAPHVWQHTELKRVVGVPPIVAGSEWPHV